MEYTILSEKIKSCFSAKLQDDAQYFRLLLDKKNAGETAKKPNDILIAEVQLGEDIYDISLKGETDIIDSEGKIIDSANVYFKIVEEQHNKGELIRNVLYLNKLSYLEIEKRDGSKNDEDHWLLSGIYYSLKDCFKILSEYEKQEMVC